MKAKGMTMEESEQLRIGDIIEVNAVIPVMPRLKLRQVKDSDKVRRLKPGHRFKIIGKGKNGRKWYKVATEWRCMRLVGWVNSVCLIGKTVNVVGCVDDSSLNKLEVSRRKEVVFAEICTVIAIIVVAIGVCWRILSVM